MIDSRKSIKQVPLIKGEIMPASIVKTPEKLLFIYKSMRNWKDGECHTHELLTFAPIIDRTSNSGSKWRPAKLTDLVFPEPDAFLGLCCFPSGENIPVALPVFIAQCTLGHVRHYKRCRTLEDRRRLIQVCVGGCSFRRRVSCWRYNKGFGRS